MRKYILWDFDGTLAYRTGKWAGALADVVAELCPELEISEAALRPHLKQGFPWQAPETIRPAGRPAAAWWAAMAPVFARAFAAVGVPAAHVPEMVPRVRAQFLKIDRWAPADGAAESLQALADSGWAQAIVSNHVPELRMLVDALGLGAQMEAVVTSASLGVEKPNPAFLRAVRERLDIAPDSWVVGDSLSADIAMAHAGGLYALHVASDIGRDPRPSAAGATAAAWRSITSLRDVPSAVGTAPGRRSRDIGPGHPV